MANRRAGTHAAYPCGFVTFHFIIDVDADIIATLVSVVVVTVLNYVLSKLLVFRGKKEEK